MRKPQDLVQSALDLLILKTISLNRSTGAIEVLSADAGARLQSEVAHWMRLSRAMDLVVNEG